MLNVKFSITPNSGNVLSTKFTTTNLTSGAIIDRYIWNYGFENLVYNEKNPTFTYEIPGVFNVTLTAIDVEGNLGTFTQTITTNLTVKDSLSFIEIPNEYSLPNTKTNTPFKISVISSNPKNPLNVDLFAANSQSIPYQFIDNKWNFLTPSWKFTDTNSNFITTLSVEPTPIYNNNTVVGISGIGEFYFIDGLGNKNNPVLITASLQTSGFSNYLDSSVYTYSSYSNNRTIKKSIEWYVKQSFPDTLKITGNYLENINKLQWQGIKIPILITCHNFLSSGIISSYPENNEAGKTYPVNISLTNLNNTQYFVENSPLYFQTTDEKGFKTGGYIFTSVTVLTSIDQTSIVAQTSALSGATMISLSGKSNDFSVLEFKNQNEIKRINESFNNAEYFKNLALPENLKSNTNLFDRFLPAVVGTGYLSANEDLGQIVYERIANFVSNHNDVDTCGVDQLLSLAQQTGIESDNFAINFPAEIKRMLDIASVSKSKLCGILDKTPLLPQSIGKELDTRFSILTAGTKIVIKNKIEGTNTIYTVPSQGDSMVYPLSTFLGYGFMQPVLIKYFFYEFNPVYSGNYIENIIDWGSESTLLSPSLSTNENWYGDGGIIEQSFRYFLTKNIFLK